jgi:hypothetical protein
MASARLPRWTSGWRLVLVLTVAVTAPLVIALVALTRTHWSPVLDLAMTELRVRDVGGRHTPLIGLPGRIGTFPDQGSHPGPLSFYLLAPTYRLLGSTSWALEAGTVLIHGAGVAVGLWLGWRRGGTRMCLAVAALFAVILRGYGSSVLSQPWNPYLPLIAWVVVLLSVWSLLEGDTPGLLAFVVAGSLCAQTHVPYLGLVGGYAVLTAIWLGVRRRFDPHAPRLAGLRPWLPISAAVGVVLWLPPVVDQLRHTPGNLSMLSDYFRNPPEQAIGLRAAGRVFLQHLDVFRVVAAAVRRSDYFTSTALTISGPLWPGVIFLVLWLASVVAAWHMRDRRLLHLHVVVAAGYALGFVATARIFGKVWYYLTFWLWAVVAFCVFAMVWTGYAWIARRPGHHAGLARWATVGCVAVLAASGLAFAWSAAHVDPPENYLSVTLGNVAAQTAQALDQRVGAATGHDGRYLVTWSDMANFGSQGYGLVNELERRGFVAGATDTFRVPITPQRVIDPSTATAEIHLANGTYIDEWINRPDAVEVAFYDPRGPAADARADELRADVAVQLTELGLDDLVAELDTNIFGVQLDPRVPASVAAELDELLHLGQPTAVFVAPPGGAG